MEEFSIYAFDPRLAKDLTPYDVAQIVLNGDPVESGLSEGELRQSLLDRLREEVLDKNIKTLAKNLEPRFDYVPEVDEKTKKHQLKHIEACIEELLYEASNSELCGVWHFSQEGIIVRAEQE